MAAALEFIPGVQVASGVVLTDGIRAYLRVLRAAVPLEIPLYVTSGVRTAASQAAAMLRKRQLGDDLHKLYRADSTISKLLAAPADPATWTAIIEAETSRGVVLSRHLGGGSFDLRVSTWTLDQAKVVQAAVLATGGRFIDEGTPPHLHVDLPTSYVTRASFLPVLFPNVSPWWWVVVGLSAILVGLVWRRRHG